MSIILKAENISKQYRLGTVGTGTLGHDLNRWWHTVRGLEDPYLQVGGVNDRSARATEDYVWALRDVNFEVKTGEVLGIIGKNGAGKTTLLKILSRVTSPTTGSIKTRGRIASLLEVGTGFHGELTGRENIYMNAAVLGMTKSEVRAKLDEIIDFSGCEMYIDTPVKRYSSGMTVRLGFAVAAHLEPEILVVDEVLAVGDAEFQKKAIGKMQDLSQGQGRTVLFVSHNMLSIGSLCSRVLLIESGGIVYNGKTKEGISRYLNLNRKIENKSLSEREDRLGDNNKFKFEQFSFKDNYNNEIESIISGESCEIEITYNSKDKIDLSNIIFTIGLKDEEGQLICFWASDEMKYILSNNNINKIVLKIPRLMLRGGDYRFWLFSSFGNTNEENFCDVIDFVANIKILPGDFWQKGKENRSNGIALIEGNYE